MDSYTRLNYSLIQRILHWLTVVLVFFNLLLPGSIERVTDLLGDGKVPSLPEWTSATLHITSGITILVFTLLRLVLRFVQGVPNAPAGEPASFQALSKIAHGLFYLVLLAMPLSGLAKFYLGVGAAGFIHGGPLKLVLWILIAAHIAAALVHQFYWRTNLLARMTSGKVT
ncbi:MAG: cytochrome [Rhizobium sp.]|nr:cytochrome [Rhizobium sp.]